MKIIIRTIESLLFVIFIRGELRAILVSFAYTTTSHSRTSDLENQEKQIPFVQLCASKSMCIPKAMGIGPLSPLYREFFREDCGEVESNQWWDAIQ